MKPSEKALTLPLFEEKAIDPCATEIEWLHDIYVAIPKDDVKQLMAWCEQQEDCANWSDIVRKLVKTFLQSSGNGPDELGMLLRKLVEQD